MTHGQSSYMRWAKTRPVKAHDLASSGVQAPRVDELPFSTQGLRVTGGGGYGYPPLLEQIARHHRVKPSEVVTTQGTSMANHLALAALLKPGDEAVIETPTYEPILATAEFLCARIRRFERREETGFALDASEVERTLTPDTKLIVLTNLHNPSGVMADREELRRLGKIAEKRGIHILVDEVYLAVADLSCAETAYHLSPAFITTNSLTKAFGLGGLRCGWLIATEEMATRIWLLNDLFGVEGAYASEQLSVLCFVHLAHFVERSRKILERNWSTFGEFLDNTPWIETQQRRLCTTVFPRLKCGSVLALYELLELRYQTSITPGRFFEMPQHFRIGLGIDPEALAAGLTELHEALQTLSKG